MSLTTMTDGETRPAISDGATPGPATTRPEPEKAPNARGPILAGLVILLIFFGGFAAWSYFLPLSSAAVAPGSVRVADNSKTVQHLEGGIIEEILVREGDVVSRNDPLIRLDTTQARASWSSARSKLNALRAQEARVIAERDRLEKPVYPDWLSSQRADSPEVAEILSGQDAIFATRQRAFEGQLEILNERVGQLDAQIDGLRAQEKSMIEQTNLIKEEIQAVSGLVKKGLAPKPRLLALQRQAAEFGGRLGEYRGRIAQAKEAIGETDLQILDLRNQRDSEIAETLRALQTDISSEEERLASAEDILKRQVILAPESGVVANLRFYTTGGVIRPGEAVLDLVPQEENLIIEAEVNPVDIDVVSVGLPAKVRLTSFDQRTTPTLKGTVTFVSADSLQKERTGQIYYKARVEIDPGQLELLKDARLYPGMPAETMIVTGEQTLFDYLIGPLKRSFDRSLREN
ncbi:HlyD family type I secretion periplasmic adaptor subunit [Oceanibacterium hippocampi]|uniref:Membrane fusion protein (MFP) family protein n=1 Tax=Oceanibacterium hippocampi TaxID=745714 RepID=A0A1Y5TV61_9PROT|nr:HlyD family type I secretion periplasmic adaptor subunit [Oceanibacterium hippocampi]SLN68869.1 Type I secretion system membrane fusion protein PrsE [Oceanibacterium hippocampi]